VNAAQEGFVGEGRQAPGLVEKHHHQLERNLEFHAVAQRQVIHAPIQRHDPAVQQVAPATSTGRPKSSMIRMPLLAFICSGAAINARGFVQAQFEHAGNQLAAHPRCRGRFAQQPARVDVGLVVLQRDDAPPGRTR